MSQSNPDYTSILLNTKFPQTFTLVNRGPDEIPAGCQCRLINDPLLVTISNGPIIDIFQVAAGSDQVTMGPIPVGAPFNITQIRWGPLLEGTARWDYCIYDPIGLVLTQIWCVIKVVTASK